MRSSPCLSSARKVSVAFALAGLALLFAGPARAELEADAAVPRCPRRATWSYRELEDRKLANVGC